MADRKKFGWGGASLPSVQAPQIRPRTGANPLEAMIIALERQKQLGPINLEQDIQKQQAMAPIELQGREAQLRQQKQIESEFLPQELEAKARFEKTKKIAIEEGNRAFGAEKEASSSRRFVQQFERSFDEIHNKLPGFDQPGLIGKSMRLGARGMNALDMLPETKAFQVRLKPIANQMARDVEGGKITDQDRQIYADSFANTLINPSETNARLISEQLIGLADKGGNISKNLEAFKESTNPVFQLIHKQVSEQLNGRGIGSVMPQQGNDLNAMVTVSNGKRSFQIPASKLADAQARGYNRA